MVSTTYQAIVQIGWNRMILFNMSEVNFGPSTINMINQSGGLINPSQSALKLMENNSWPIYVTGPNQIIFHIMSPFVYFPGTLVAMEGLMYDVQWVLDNGGFGTPASINTYFNQHPIPGTGPYMVTQIAENAYIKYTQNPSYWGKNFTSSQINALEMFDPGHAKNVIVYYKTDDIVRYTDLVNGVCTDSRYSIVKFQTSHVESRVFLLHFSKAGVA